MQSRHLGLMLDLDDTLINFQQSTHEVVTWNGSLELWQDCLASLKTAVQSAGHVLHIGIITSKTEFRDQYYERANVPGDQISAVVLEQVLLERAYPSLKNLKFHHGLRKFINRELVFFTSGYCKVEKGMNYVKARIEQVLGKAPINKSDMIMLDDSLTVCNSMLKNGYSAIFAGGLCKLPVDKQRIEILKFFRQMCDIFQISIPEAFLDSETPQPKIKNLKDKTRRENISTIKKYSIFQISYDYAKDGEMVPLKIKLKKI